MKSKSSLILLVKALKKELKQTLHLVMYDMTPLGAIFARSRSVQKFQLYQTAAGCPSHILWVGLDYLRKNCYCFMVPFFVCVFNFLLSTNNFIYENICFVFSKERLTNEFRIIFFLQYLIQNHILLLKPLSLEISCSYFNYLNLISKCKVNKRRRQKPIVTFRDLIHWKWRTMMKFLRQQIHHPQCSLKFQIQTRQQVHNTTGKLYD